MMAPRETTALRLAGTALLFATLVATPAGEAGAMPRPSDPLQSASFEAASLRSIAAWLKDSGRDGYLSAEVADTVGIPRARNEDYLDAKQRGYRNDGILRIAQVSADARRDFLLFMVQRPEGEVYFYLSSVRDGLKRAFVSIPGRKMVVPMDAAEAQSRFDEEVAYWHDRMK